MEKQRKLEGNEKEKRQRKESKLTLGKMKGNARGGNKKDKKINMKEITLRKEGKKKNFGSCRVLVG
jgi:hypothetical protein